PLQRRRLGKTVVEPDMAIVGRQRHPLVGHGAQGPFRDRARIFVIEVSERGSHDKAAVLAWNAWGSSRGGSHQFVKPASSRGCSGAHAGARCRPDAAQTVDPAADSMA